MIKSFKHKGLKLLWTKNNTTKLPADHIFRINMILDVLDNASDLKDFNLPGFNFHQLTGHRPKRWSMHVNGNYCITFHWNNNDVEHVDYEDYH